MTHENKEYNILVFSNERKIVNKLSMLFEKNKYHFSLVRDPLSTINNIIENDYDLIIINFDFPKKLLDLLLNKIRLYDSFIYVMLTFKNNKFFDALDIIKNHDVQAYHNLDDDFTDALAKIELIKNSIYEFNRINLRLDDYELASKSPYLSTVQILRNITEYKDRYTIRHSFRVSKYSLLIGRAMKLSRNDLKTLKIGSMFHDIGKISVPNNILIKDSVLTEKEYLQIKAHPLIGSHFLYPAIIYSNVIPIVKFHHEKFDGSGYPAKLKETDIPLLARIVSIADTFDAMTSKRTYRDALPIDSVIFEFEKNKGTQFDPEITDIFLDIIKNNFNKIKKIQNQYK